MHRLTRPSYLVLTVALLPALLAAPPAAAQDDDRFADVEISATEVAGGVWMLQGAGGNIGVSAGDDGVFLIDDQFAPLTDKIRAAVAEISDGPIRFVLNTHWHGDHTGGNENLGEAGAVIVAHANVRQRMSTEQFQAAFDRTVPASPDAALPVITYEGGVTFHLNGDTIHAWHTLPAHTDGDSAVYFEEADVLHAGDLFFNGFYPFIDVASGGSAENLAHVVGELLDEVGEETKIIPGHGPLAERADLERYHRMLQGVVAAVTSLVARGMDRDQVIAAEPTAPWDEEWGGGFMKPEIFTGIVYDSLTRD